MSKENGCVYWITGLSGAGKTAISTKLYEYLKEKKDNIVRLDGDILREVFLNKDYSYDGRKALAYQYGNLCKMISMQGIDVVIGTISMYHDVRNWNRNNIPVYKEVFLDVHIDELIRRDQKGIYAKALRSKEDMVFGLNMEAEYPQNPDLVIKNYGGVNPDMALKVIVEKFCL